MTKALFNTLILMAILQLAGPPTQVVAADVHMIEETIHGTVRAAREQGVPDRILSDLLALAVHPDLGEALYNRGLALHRLGLRAAESVSWKTYLDRYRRGIWA